MSAPSSAAAAPLRTTTRALLGAGRRGRRTGWLAPFVVLVLGWQTTAFLALVADWFSLVAYVAGQVAGAAALAAALLLRARRAGADERIGTALQVLAWSAAAGPFGAFAAVALAFPFAPAGAAARAAEPEDTTEEAARQARVEQTHTALLDRRLRLGGVGRVRPLVDVVAEGSRSERLEALRVVYRNYDARLGAVLRRGLYDPDASVRVLAATVTARLHFSYVRAIGERQSEAAASPEPAGASLALAEARLAYAASGLLERDRARAQIEAAIGDLECAAGAEPAGPALPRLAEARRLLAADAR